MMKASDARKLAQSAAPDISHLTSFVEKKIGAAAESGKQSISNPLDGIRTPVSQAQKSLMWAELRRNGFAVRTSGETVTVSWKLPPKPKTKPK